MVSSRRVSKNAIVDIKVYLIPFFFFRVDKPIESSKKARKCSKFRQKFHMLFEP